MRSSRKPSASVAIENGDALGVEGENREIRVPIAVEVAGCEGAGIVIDTETTHRRGGPLAGWIEEDLHQRAGEVDDLARPGPVELHQQKLPKPERVARSRRRQAVVAESDGQEIRPGSRQRLEGQNRAERGQDDSGWHVAPARRGSRNSAVGAADYPKWRSRNSG